MRLKSRSVKHQKIRASINHEALGCTVIFAIAGGLVLGIAKRHSSVILSVISIVLYVLSIASFVSHMKSLPGRGLFAKLKLSSEQKEKTKLVLADQGAKLMELHKDRSLSLAVRRAKVYAIYDDSDAKFKEIFTADQYAKYQDMRKAMLQQSLPIVSGNTAAKPDAKQD